MVAWFTEMFLNLFRFANRALKSNLDSEERSAIAAEFNDPGSKVDILITTYRTCSTGINLHQACHNVVFLEPAVNANTLWQAIGRVHRIGQTEVVRVLILFTDGTFNRTVGYNQRKKYAAEVTGINAGDAAADEAGDEETRSRRLWDDPGRLSDDDAGDAALNYPADEDPVVRTPSPASETQEDTEMEDRSETTAPLITAQAAAGLPTITSTAYDDSGEIDCLFITSWIGDVKVPRTLVDSGAVVDLISPALVNKLGDMTIRKSPQTYPLKLANDELQIVTASTIEIDPPRHAMANASPTPEFMAQVQAAISSAVAEAMATYRRTQSEPSASQAQQVPRPSPDVIDDSIQSSNGYFKAKEVGYFHPD
ncbi:MAG: hypothetical protein M1825_003318 [Sarcosagium campestre]|nr:MAG: hypothetical protein M1825_003318 [Sarcosagium campestre]